MTGDGQVVKRIKSKGEGEFPIDCPLEDSHVRVHYRWVCGSLVWVIDTLKAC